MTTYYPSAGSGQAVGGYYEKQGGTVTKYYYFGGKRVAMRKGSTLTYLHGDHLGSTSLATDGTSGGFKGRVLYFPYGETRHQEGTLPTDYRFTGQRQEGYTQLYEMGARWYDAQIGRWISADTIVPDPPNPQSLNRFSYVLGNPVRYTDPSGHCIPGDLHCPYNDETGGMAAPTLPAGQYLYSKEYGWFDKNHLNTGNPERVINDVSRVIADGGGPVDIEQPLGRGPIQGNYIEHYQISSKATPEDTVGIALGMYMHWSMGFEQWESTISVLGIRTAFAIEDLPSHYIGFYAKANGLSYAEVFATLGDIEGTNEEPPRITPWPPWNPGAWNWEVKNFFFTPRVQDNEGNWHNIPWPDALTIVPIGSESGLWEFRGAECQGDLCRITRPQGE